MLLQNGAVPAPLLEPGRGVDLGHRDSRLALGTLPDGRVVIALTRFDALGGVLGGIPFGLTSPEMAAVMGALGCREALLLDGGIWASSCCATWTARRGSGPGSAVCRSASWAGRSPIHHDFGTGSYLAVNRTLMSTFPILVAGSCEVTPTQV